MVLTAEDPSVAWRSARLPAEDAQSLSVDGSVFGHQWIFFWEEVSVCNSYSGKLPGLAPAAVMNHRLFAFTRRYSNRFPFGF
jgi:hypothetical protein